MDTKLIFFDIDGTLINDKGELPASAAEAIKTARQNGHLCLVNTGRTASIVLDWLPQLAEFDGYLCGCGTQILFRGKELLHHTFTKELSERIIEKLDQYKIDAILEGAENDYHNDLDRMHTVTFHDYICKYYSKRHWGNYREAVGRFDKFYCFADDRQSVCRFGEEMEGELDLIDRGKGFFEVVPAGFSKATGMDYLADYLMEQGILQHVDRTNFVAVGDSTNDLPMLEHAGCAIAMKVCAPEVYRIADYVTADVMDNGIADALDWLGVLKKSAK